MQSFFLVVGLAHFVFGKPNQEWRDSNELTSNGLPPSCERYTLTIFRYKNTFTNKYKVQLITIIISKF